MRERFGHLIPYNDEELRQVWSLATLTVNANVLLDLYRYHEQTRNQLLVALKRFQNRMWLSHQAAQEFFRNRRNVIAAANKDFEDAEKVLKQLAATTEGLRTCRLIPRALTTDLTNGVRREVEIARNALKLARESHPNFLTIDPILNEIISLFDGGLGPAPRYAEQATLEAEGEHRQERKLPPGYMDVAKEAGRAFGDYLLWAQVLDQMTTSAQPMILVTSEKKEDWWEKHHGQRFPRWELLDEAARVTGKRILIYETEHFLRIAEEMQGNPLEPKVFAEIRAVELARGREQSTLSEAEEQIVYAVESLAYFLVNADDVITGLIAETNASGFTPEGVEVHEIGSFDFAEARLPFEASIRFTGEPDDSRMYAGDTILANIKGWLQFDGGTWEVVDFSVTAEIEDWRENEPDD